MCLKVSDNLSVGVGIELKTNHGAPISCCSNLVMDFVWKVTSFNRMQAALRKFAVSAYIYHRLRRHDVDDVLFQTHLPKHFSASNLPDLKRSQVKSACIVIWQIIFGKSPLKNSKQNLGEILRPKAR